MRMHSIKVLMSCLMFALVFCGSPAQAKMFKWKDENGQIHYGDKVPTRYLDKERKELNSEGHVVKNVDRAMTAEEREEKKRLAAVAEEKEKELEEARKRDRVLLDTYTTERDLIIARDARIDAVNSQVQLSNSIIASANKKLEKTEKQIAKIKASNKEVPAPLLKKLKREKSQLAAHNKVSDGHKQKLEDIQTQFGGYIARFNELKQKKMERRQATANKKK